MSDCELPEFYTHSEPVARKEHRCCECRAPILKGEKHFSSTGKWDGTVISQRQHLDCMAACILIRDKFNDSECIPFGGLKDWFFEMRRDCRDDSEESRTLRSLMARIKWRERKYRRRVKT